MDLNNKFLKEQQWSVHNIEKSVNFQVTLTRLFLRLYQWILVIKFDGEQIGFPLLTGCLRAKSRKDHFPASFSQMCSTTIREAPLAL